MKFLHSDVLTIKKIILEYIKKNNCSQNQLSLLTGISRPTFRKILNEEVGTLHFNTLYKLFEADDLPDLSKEKIREILIKYYRKDFSKKESCKQELEIEKLKEILFSLNDALKKNDEKISKIKDAILKSLLQQENGTSKQNKEKPLTTPNDYMQVRAFTSDFSTTARAINLLFKLKIAPSEYYSELMLLLSTNGFKSNQKIAKGIKETAEQFIDMGNNLLKIIDEKNKDIIVEV